MSVHVVAGERLKDKLERSAQIAGCSISVAAERSKPWSAAMFMGGLHELTVTVHGATAERWLDCLDEYAIHLPGFVLSKLEVTTVEPVANLCGQLIATIEAETVREA